MNSQLTIALHILGFLASRGGAALTSEELARTYGTNPVVLRRVLAKLQRAGLVATQRGTGGGSTLARDASQITLRDAYSAVNDDTQVLQRHPENGPGVVAPILARYVNELFAEAERALLTKLESVTVADMDQEVRGRICAALSEKSDGD